MRCTTPRVGVRRRCKLKADSSRAQARASALLLVALAACVPCRAAPEGGTAAGTPPLDLRLPAPSTATTAPRAAAPERQRPTLRLEPRKTFIERGVGGSREALIACQNGAYPGATVAAAAVQVSGGDSQPGHCYRF